MPGKKFISKKNAVTYRLVPRCQLDPDADSSEHVLVPVDEEKHNKFAMKLPACALPPAKEPPKSKTQIPQMGYQHKWDPDIMAALADDFDDAGVLEDNFVAMASGCVGETQAFNEFENGSENGDRESLFSDEDECFSGSVDGEEAKKPKHTQYSLTDCNEDTQILNERFERFCGTYDDDQIGALDFEEIDGYHDPVKDTIEGREASFVDYRKTLDPYENGLDEHLKQKTLLYADTSSDEESDSEEEVTEEDPKYDCESIISTYSNKHNHPVLIKVEKKEKPVSKISTNLWKQSLTKSNLRKIDREDVEEEDVGSVVSENETIVSTCIRPKNETSEEKRQRKQAVKQQRKENRMLKKESKLAFKEEKKKTSSAVLNTNRNRVVRLSC